MEDKTIDQVVQDMSEFTISMTDENKTDEELIKDVANEFITKEGIGGYTFFEEMNDLWRNGDNSDKLEMLWQLWKNKWSRYITTERRRSLIGEITETACKRYYKRYKKEKGL